MVALVNSTTVMFSLALLPIDFKPSLRQLAEQFLWIITCGGTPGWIRLLSLYRSVRNLYPGRKITGKSLVIILLQETIGKSLKILEKSFSLLRPVQRIQKGILLRFIRPSIIWNSLSTTLPKCRRNLGVTLK